MTTEQEEPEAAEQEASEEEASEEHALLNDRERWVAELELNPGLASHMILTINQRLREIREAADQQELEQEEAMIMCC